ncbi:MAG TPA: hypothetical protein VGX37_09790 [Allosphingosinicella sp.]|jgi:hypothetical protein|nr:hypothetical protein [Allosphingosinicella sp.]
MLVRAGRAAALILALAVGSAAAGQGRSEPPRPAPVQSVDESLAEDAADYARRHGVALAEALRRLRAQQDSVAATDLIRRTYADRLAGMSIEHEPEWRIVVLLTGSEPVRDRFISAGGRAVPVVFRTGAAATRAALVQAIATHRAAIAAMLPGLQGIGADERTGELVLHVRGEHPDPSGEVEAAIAALAGVPVRIRPLDARNEDAGVEGGARVAGVEPLSGGRQYCTTGFVVTDGARSGVVTAAHCPDDLTYYDPEDGRQVALSFVGGWGARYQDVQVHVSDVPLRPLFFAASDKSRLRTLTAGRARDSIRAGETVCHRGETTGYSCAEVELVDYAPAGDLCGGPCDPVWVTVAGPACRGGDSGGPVFTGTTAFGIFKGSSRHGDACRFYFFMSTDYLPEGWTLLRDPAADAPAGALRAP